MNPLKQMNNEIGMNKVLIDIKEEIDRGSCADAASIMLETGESIGVRATIIEENWSQRMGDMECQVWESLALTLGEKEVLKCVVWATFGYSSDRTKEWKYKEESIDYDINGFSINKILNEVDMGNIEDHLEIPDERTGIMILEEEERELSKLIKEQMFIKESEENFIE